MEIDVINEAVRVLVSDAIEAALLNSLTKVNANGVSAIATGDLSEQRPSHQDSSTYADPSCELNFQLSCNEAYQTKDSGQKLLMSSKIDNINDNVNSLKASKDVVSVENMGDVHREVAYTDLESKLAVLDLEFEAITGDSAEEADVYRYKQLMLKQRETMIEMANRLKVQDGAVYSLQRAKEEYNSNAYSLIKLPKESEEANSDRKDRLGAGIFKLAKALALENSLRGSSKDRSKVNIKHQVAASKDKMKDSATNLRSRARTGHLHRRFGMMVGDYDHVEWIKRVNDPKHTAAAVKICHSPYNQKIRPVTSWRSKQIIEGSLDYDTSKVNKYHNNDNIIDNNNNSNSNSNSSSSKNNFINGNESPIELGASNNIEMRRTDNSDINIAPLMKEPNVKDKNKDKETDKDKNKVKIKEALFRALKYQTEYSHVKYKQDEVAMSRESYRKVAEKRLSNSTNNLILNYGDSVQITNGEALEAHLRRDFDNSLRTFPKKKPVSPPRAIPTSCDLPVFMERPINGNSIEEIASTPLDMSRRRPRSALAGTYTSQSIYIVSKKDPYSAIVGASDFPKVKDSLHFFSDDFLTYGSPSHSDNKGSRRFTDDVESSSPLRKNLKKLEPQGLALKIDGTSGFQRGDRGISPISLRLVDSCSSPQVGLYGPKDNRHMHDMSNGNNNKQVTSDVNRAEERMAEERSGVDIDTEVLCNSISRSHRNSTFVKDKNYRSADFFKDTSFTPVQKPNSCSFGSAMFDPKNIGMYYYINKSGKKERLNYSVKNGEKLDDAHYDALVSLINDKNSDRNLVKEVLSRVLHPFYEIEDVEYFHQLYCSIDSDLSMDLNVNEWCELMHQLSPEVNENISLRIFHDIDSRQNNQGHISLESSIDIIFSEIDYDRRQLIVQYLLSDFF